MLEELESEAINSKMAVDSSDSEINSLQDQKEDTNKVIENFIRKNPKKQKIDENVKEEKS